MTTSTSGFNASQQQYLAGLVFGADVARAVSQLPILSGCATAGNGDAASVRIGGKTDGNAATADKNGGQAAVPAGPDRAAWEAQNATLAAGGKLCREEQAKRERNGLDVWDEIAERAQRGQFPKGNDVFLTKYHGLFYVAPAQDAFMCRMRIPGGLLRGWQLRGIAALAERCAGGTLDVTTRANLQLRDIPAEMPMEVLYGLRELDITCQGSGADNVRNCTSSPLSGIDPLELIETLPLAKRMHHHILANRDLSGLPRKFNIAFDGAGSVASLDDTNDIGFRAVQVSAAVATAETPAGIYFRLTLVGITGHKDFARDTGILLRPEECIEVAAAIVRVFVRSGNRTDRNKARLKYVLDEWGFEKFLAAVEEQLGRSLRRFELDLLDLSSHENRFAHVGIHPQKQSGLHYVGVVLPVGRLTSLQAAALADLADCYGQGELRLTVWQNLLIPHIPTKHLETLQQSLKEIGLDCEASSVRAGLVACTGNAGCKYAGANTKLHALQLAEFLESQVQLDQPLNLHLTGCHHSCAQHYIGDIGLLACQVEQGEEMVEGYHIHIGGGWGERQAIARLLFSSVPYSECGELLLQLLMGYLEQRRPEEDFAQFAARKSDDELKGLILQSSLPA